MDNDYYYGCVNINMAISIIYIVLYMDQNVVVLVWCGIQMGKLNDALSNISGLQLNYNYRDFTAFVANKMSVTCRIIEILTVKCL